MGQHLLPVSQSEQAKKSGYISEVTVYQATNCQRCPLRSLCQPSKKQESIKGNRTVTINDNLEKHREKARENLGSLQGRRLRSKRPVDVEPVFGHIKYNRRFDRLTLKSLPKINVEVGLLCMAHNLKKIWKFLQIDGIGLPRPTNFANKTKQNEIIGLFSSILDFLSLTLWGKYHNAKLMEMKL